MSSINWISFVFNTMFTLLKGLWVKWGIQLLVAATIACNIILTILGSRRKYMTSILARFSIWAAYLLLSYFATLALGKLTVVRIDDPHHPGYDVVLDGLLAPLILMQLGYSDGITAYAVEDNRLGLRQMLNIGVTVGFVVWILFRCWDGSSPVSRLYFLLSVAGLVKSVGRVWALRFVYGENSSVTAENIREAIEIREVLLNELPEDGKFASAKDILKAYFRFDCLKPHLVNWLYHPLFISRDGMSIDGYTAHRAFTMTEIELNFMFDVLYTKAPILYTKVGLIGRFVSFFCLVSSLCGFAIIFKNVFLIDMYVTYTYALLMAVTSLELYQIMVLPFSDWAVVKMSTSLKVPLVRRFLPCLADWCMKKKRWSRSIGQLNLLDRHLLHKKWPKPIDMVLGWFGKGEFFRRYQLHSCKAIPSCLMELVVQKMTELEKKRDQLPFTERGLWTLESRGIQETKGLSDSIETTFDKAIIIWHIATEILHILQGECSDACRGSKLLSDYMMYLLALHPHMLSLSTADHTLDHACCKLRPFFERGGRSESARDILTYRDDREASLVGGDVTAPVDPRKATGAAHRIIGDWHLLSEVQQLVVDLKTMGNRWEIISSVWVEMLCYAAHNCRVYHHDELLGKGGELITHVWLLLAHKTDKYHEMHSEDTNVLATATSPASGKGFSSCFQRLLGKREANIYDRRK